MAIDGSSGQVTVRYADHGKQKVETERIEVPPDLANGLILTLLKNVPTGGPPKTVSLVAATPKPRLVKLAISAAGEESFSTGGASRKAMHYVLKVEIGGISGVLAPLLGKQPPDSHVWILGGEAPAFVKSEQPLYLGGPLWRIELVSPVWPRTGPAPQKQPRAGRLRGDPGSGSSNALERESSLSSFRWWWSPPNRRSDRTANDSYGLAP